MTDRPPTILSPHGEGYCRHCRFVVGLDADGLMDAHSRGQNFPQVCEGGGKVPSKLTPYASGKAQFHSKPMKATCPDCGTPNILVNRGDLFERHYVGPVMNRSTCRGSFKPYNPQP